MEQTRQRVTSRFADEQKAADEAFAAGRLSQAMKHDYAAIVLDQLHVFIEQILSSAEGPERDAFNSFTSAHKSGADSPTKQARSATRPLGTCVCGTPIYFDHGQSKRVLAAWAAGLVFLGYAIGRRGFR
jgi:hypothetical protein